MQNEDIIEQVICHLRDAAYLAAMIDRRPASDSDWKVMKAMDLICEAEVVVRGIKEDGRCGLFGVGSLSVR